MSFGQVYHLPATRIAHKATARFSRDGWSRLKIFWNMIKEICVVQNRSSAELRRSNQNGSRRLVNRTVGTCPAEIEITGHNVRMWSEILNVSRGCI